MALFDVEFRHPQHDGKGKVIYHAPTPAYAGSTEDRSERIRFEAVDRRAALRRIKSIVNDPVRAITHDGITYKPVIIGLRKLVDISVPENILAPQRMRRFWNKATVALSANEKVAD